MGEIVKKRIYLIAGLGVILDQMTKLFACLYLKNIEIIPNFFNLTYVENTGGAWGILDNNRVVLIGVSVITILIINKYINSDVQTSKLSSICYGMLLGGIFGNLFDRIFRGFVVDFLNFTIFGYNFPVFNIADSIIIIGVILMFIEVIGETYGSKSKKK